MVAKIKKIRILLAKSKKLGDSLIAASAISDFQRQVVEEEIVILASTSMREAFGFYGLKARFYRNDLAFLPIALYYGLLGLQKNKSFSLVGVTGRSGNFDLLRRLVRPHNWVTREKDFVITKSGDRFQFSHLKQLEYCNRVLEISNSVFRGVDYILPPPFDAPQFGKSIIICPNSAEARRSMTTRVLLSLVEKLLQQGKSRSNIKILLNDADERQIIDRNWVSDNIPWAEVTSPKNLVEITATLSSALEIHTVDTAFYAVASSLGVKNIYVYFGPTQPEKSDYDGGRLNTRKIRDPALGNSHCPVFECKKAICIESAMGLAIESNTEPVKGCLLDAKGVPCGG